MTVLAAAGGDGSVAVGGVIFVGIIVWVVLGWWLGIRPCRGCGACRRHHR